MNFSDLIDPDEVNNKPFIFLSYSRNDMPEVQKILKILRENHFRFWYDKGLKSGSEWAEELGDMIDKCEQFLVLISRNSVISKYVRKEIRMAIDRDKNILVLYLEKTELTNGLHLLLDDIQAVHKEYFNKEKDFVLALCKAASNNTLYQESNGLDDSYASVSGTAKTELTNNYQLLTLIGAGGMGQVYLAHQNRTGVLAAVKCGLIDATYRGTVVKDCFNTEKIILLDLMRNICPYIPIILDWFEDDTHVFLVETFIDGKPLNSQNYYSEDDVVEIAKKVLKILQYMHKNNIIYRDIKPSNLIMDKYGEVHLIDFNTAIKADKENLRGEILLGTVGFAPPEQFKADSVLNAASDIFALGRTLEYLLCPEHFDKNSRFPIRYYRKDISVKLESILEKMTAVSQEDRYQDAEELLKEFEKYKGSNFFIRLPLFVKSKNNIKTFEKENIKNMEERNNLLHEMAVDSQSYGNEGLDETIILSGSDMDI